MISIQSFMIYTPLEDVNVCVEDEKTLVRMMDSKISKLNIVFFFDVCFSFFCFCFGAPRIKGSFSEILELET